MAFEIVRTDLGRQATCHFAHRRQQWQRATGELHGLVGEGGAARRDECLGHLGVGGEMQICEQGEVGAEEAELFGLWFFHLHHHLLRPRIGSRGHDGGARRAVVVVAEASTIAGTRFHEHVDAESFELAHAIGGHRHPVFGGLDFAGYPNGTDARMGRGGGHGSIVRHVQPTFSGDVVQEWTYDQRINGTRCNRPSNHR